MYIDTQTQKTIGIYVHIYVYIPIYIYIPICIYIPRNSPRPGTKTPPELTSSLMNTATISFLQCR